MSNQAGKRAVDAYIAAAPRAAQPHLRRLRDVIKGAAPKAEEKISYGMPFYEYHGRLVYFAAFKKHVGLYAVGEAKGLQRYFYGASTLRFPFGEPLPAEWKAQDRKSTRLNSSHQSTSRMPSSA